MKPVLLAGAALAASRGAAQLDLPVAMAPVVALTSAVVDTSQSGCYDDAREIPCPQPGELDFGCYWSSTTHLRDMDPEGEAAVYVAFGRAMGYMRGRWMDVHGAGAQRSDPKAGNPDDHPFGRGPQGDAIRILNLVRPVRTADREIAPAAVTVRFARSRYWYTFSSAAKASGASVSALRTGGVAACSRYHSWATMADITSLVPVQIEARRRSRTMRSTGKTVV